MHCRVLSVRGEQITGSSVSCKGYRGMRGQLFICELLKEIQRFLSAHRAQVAGQTRLAIEREAQQYLDITLIFCQMGKVIFSSPGCFTRNSARRAWTLKFFRVQPLKISSDFLLRGSKSVQDL